MEDEVHQDKMVSLDVVDKLMNELEIEFGQVTNDYD